MTTSNLKKDLIAGVAILIVASLFLIGALLMPKDNIYGLYAYPGITPLALSLGLVVMALVLIFRTVNKTVLEKKVTDFSPPSQSEEKNFLTSVELKRLVVVILFCLGYLLLLGKIHFVVLTSIFLALLSFIFYRKQVLIIIATSVGTSILIYYVFNRIFLLPIP